MSFGLVPPDQWGLDHRKIGRRRRTWLLDDTPFPQIVARLAREVELLQLNCEAGKKTKIGFHRWRATLKADPDTVDLWHNGRGGYRAQYYLEPETGERANRLALDRLSNIVAAQIEQDQHRRHHWPRAQVSLLHPAVRLWVYQGLWLRHPAPEDQALRVERWQSHASSAVRDVRKLVRWGGLAPRETRIRMIGQWLRDADRKPDAGPPKPKRPQRISDYGFV